MQMTYHTSNLHAFLANAQLVFLLINFTMLNFTEAGTWLSFNQKSGGSENDMMPHNRLFPKTKERYPLREQFINPTIPEENNPKSIINLLELCNERSKRKRFTQPIAPNDLCNTLLRAVDYEMQNKRRK